VKKNRRNTGFRRPTSEALRRRRARLLATAEVHQLGATREVQKNLDVAIVEMGKHHETQWAKL
jgi:hypothetical protein